MESLQQIHSFSSKLVKSESVKVCVRCRPMAQKELAEKKIVEIDTKKGIVSLEPNKINKNSNDPIKQFTFDAVFDWNAKQSDIYDDIVRPLVNSVLEGFNGTVFAYGQTGTGKTYTIEGIRNDSIRKGIIPNAFEHIFSYIAQSTCQQYLVRSSYLEIYQEQIRDLLANDQTKRLELKEKADIGVYVKDLSSFVCKNIKEIENVMTLGNRNRSVAETNMNDRSSRSHAIFIITIEHTSVGVDGQTHIRVGRLNLVDLAGSERQIKTGVTGQRQKEAIKINLSLSALGNVISALVDGKSSHIPYRDSKLTRLLKDSLGGNSKTVMVAHIGPAGCNYEETLTTLRYANRAKNIKNRPRVNEDPKDALLREFQLEIERLRLLLNEKKRKRGEKDEDLNKKHWNFIDKETTENLSEKIKAMESKLLRGGKNIIDHTNEQQQELGIKRQQIAEQKRKEREMLQKIEEQDENTLEIRDTFTSLQQEVELKRRKLRKLFAKLQCVRGEIEDNSEANSRERRELEELQEELMKELKLKYLVIENFIPSEDKNIFLSNIFYDEDDEEWKLKKPLEGRKYIRRPISNLYQNKNSNLSPRFNENVIKLDLIMPSKLTKNYKLPVMTTCFNALESDLRIEEEIIDASIFSNGVHKEKESLIQERPKSSVKGTSFFNPQSSQPDTAAFIINPLKKIEISNCLSQEDKILVLT